MYSSSMGVYVMRVLSTIHSSERFLTKNMDRTGTNCMQVHVHVICSQVQQLYSAILYVLDGAGILP